MAGRQCEEEIRLLKACSLHWKSKMHVYVRAWWQGEPRQVGHSQDGTSSVQFSSVTQLCLTLRDPMASLSITNSQCLLKLMSTESVMPSNQLILCHPLLLLPSILPSIRLFSSELVLHIR